MHHKTYNVKQSNITVIVGRLLMSHWEVQMAKFRFSIASIKGQKTKESNSKYTYISVSYTHLDVYKRQLHMSAF